MPLPTDPTRRPLTLVMGARRGIGRLVLDRVVAAGVGVRASARSTEHWSLPAGVDQVRADLTDLPSLRTALEGVSRVFLFAVPESAHAVAEAVRAAGVERVVLLSSGSVLVPTSDDNPITVEHRAVEAAFADAVGAALVPVRPLVLATNALAWAGQVKATGTVRLYRPDALTAPVHEADVAAVAAAALLDARPSTHVSDLLTGPRQTSQRAQVDAVARALGREIAVVEQTREEALAHLGPFTGQEQADAIVRFLDDCAAGHSPATGTAEAALGRAGLPFERWAVDHVADFR